MSLDGVTQVGRISKQWMGLLREAFVDADTFGITCKHWFVFAFKIESLLTFFRGKAKIFQILGYYFFNRGGLT